MAGGVLHRAARGHSYTEAAPFLWLRLPRRGRHRSGRLTDDTDSMGWEVWLLHEDVTLGFRLFISGVPTPRGSHPMCFSLTDWLVLGAARGLLQPPALDPLEAEVGSRWRWEPANRVS